MYIHVELFCISRKTISKCLARILRACFIINGVDSLQTMSSRFIMTYNITTVYCLPVCMRLMSKRYSMKGLLEKGRQY